MNESGRQVGAAGQVLLGRARRRHRDPRRARHRLRPDPAEARRRRRRATTGCGRWLRRWAPRTFSGCASASAARRAARIRRAFVLENFTAAERPEVPADLRAGRRRHRTADPDRPRGRAEHRARLVADAVRSVRGAPRVGPQRERCEHGGHQQRPQDGRQHRMMQRQLRIRRREPAVAPQFTHGLRERRHGIPLRDHAQPVRHRLGGCKRVGQERDREQHREHHPVDGLHRPHQRSDRGCRTR